MKIKNSKESTKKAIEVKNPKESTEKAIEIKNPEESIKIKNPKEMKKKTDCYDKNEFKKILAIADSNKFNHKNKIDKFRYNKINDLIDNIKNNTICEILA